MRITRILLAIFKHSSSGTQAGQEVNMRHSIRPIKLDKNDENTFLETLVDIAFGLGWAQVRLDSEDSRSNIDLIIQAAVDFETRHSGTDWTQVDYFDEIDNYIKEISARNPR
jgi:hypothetical protein